MCNGVWVCQSKCVIAAGSARSATFGGVAQRDPKTQQVTQHFFSVCVCVGVCKCPEDKCAIGGCRRGKRFGQVMETGGEKGREVYWEADISEQLLCTYVHKQV